jgi:hypothetical protein
MEQTIISAMVTAFAVGWEAARQYGEPRDISRGS